MVTVSNNEEKERKKVFARNSTWQARKSRKNLTLARRYSFSIFEIKLLLLLPGDVVAALRF